MGWLNDNGVVFKTTCRKILRVCAAAACLWWWWGWVETYVESFKGEWCGNEASLGLGSAELADYTLPPEDFKLNSMESEETNEGTVGLLVDSWTDMRICVFELGGNSLSKYLFRNILR